MGRSYNNKCPETCINIMFRLNSGVRRQPKIFYIFLKQLVDFQHDIKCLFQCKMFKKTEQSLDNRIFFHTFAAVKRLNGVSSFVLKAAIRVSI